ncbi:BREX-1 system adenine-specific DNA-methyltransferase PglX, partial [Chryseobacterium sp. FP211-J200]
MKNLNDFKSDNFFENASSFFQELNIPLKSIDNQAYRPEDFLSNTYNAKSPAHSLVDKVYLLGIVDDDAFIGESQYDSLEKISTITTDYEGLAVVGIELKNRDGDLLPTRSQLAEITRAVNREFLYTPVTVLFKYNGFLALANAERTSYMAKYKEGEKVGKVSLLRDVDYTNPHTGHLQILNDLKKPEKIKTFADLYKHWGGVFSVNVLNKKFYQELSNWYFWAIQNVTFPGQPTFDDATLQNKDYKDLKQQHNATNVIRMLTRLLFVWFMKEKKLIPEELFELQNLQTDILNEIEPLHEKGLFTERNKDSVYYKAILQNLFFATLNCPIKSDTLDKRERGFRGDGYGTNRGIDYLMRYKKYFKDPEAFLAKVNDVVPFLNGGLFECLDDKFSNNYIDGFSDQMTKGEQLIVPDYLFFGLEEEADLSDVIGITDKKTKNSAVKGLINILKSYKFTITENTPIEEEVALDPELLGKVFENLLASYNPETKTTARKQTGSFYTPREIVNYMVDESLIAYLKNKIQSADVIITELGTLQSNLFGNEGVRGQASLMQHHSGSELKDNETLLDELLHQLVTYNSENPFVDYPETSKIILEHLDQCTILDPACGSGAFPMGILQKMVHILDKLDPDNKIWREVQIEKAKKDSDDAFAIEDKQAREDLLIEINEAFDENINNPDYARKLFLIENCIYGVDIQPIATQISKLRFFISLVVEQKVDREKANFGIRPLPNLETKLVAANTLIGIEKEDNLFSLPEIEILEQKLRQTRNKLFNARTKDTKIKYRELDKQLRQEIAEKLKENGLPLASAEKLATWDPYNQNASSKFFDPEWMFGLPKINGGFFDIV